MFRQRHQGHGFLMFCACVLALLLLRQNVESLLSRGLLPPPARPCDHASGTFGKKRALRRYHCDVWLFDVTTETWSQPAPGITDSEGDFLRPWADIPAPRGAHCACYAEDVVPEDNGEEEGEEEDGNSDDEDEDGASAAAAAPRKYEPGQLRRRLFVFGGYGEAAGLVMFGRVDYNDLYALDLDSWEWEVCDCGGDLPDPRSAAQMAFVPAVVPPNEEATRGRVYVSGGWSALGQFQDVWSLDVNSFEWTLVESASGPAWGPERWEHSMVAVKAVPHWKLFSFGGKTGDLTMETGMPLGTFASDLLVLETGSSAPDRWVNPGASTDAAPTPRADAPVAYDPGSLSLVLFGGWNNRWLGDLWVCRMRDVVGPPYSIFAIEPGIGPVTGDTKVTIRGMGLAGTSGDCNVAVACPKGTIEVPGTVLSDTELTFVTPDYRDFGMAQDVHLRIRISSSGLTNTAVELKLFEVTEAKESIVFGPGILDGCAAGEPVSIVIQAKDQYGNDRWCGMDEFSVTVQRTLDDEELRAGVKEAIEVAIEDQGDGTYTCTYTLPQAGEYTLHANFNGTFNGTEGPCMGSPFVFRAAASSELAEANFQAAKVASDAAAAAEQSCQKRWERAAEVLAADVTDEKAQSAEIEAKIKLEKATKAREEAAAKRDTMQARKADAVNVNVNALHGPNVYKALTTAIKQTKSFAANSLAALK